MHVLLYEYIIKYRWVILLVHVNCCCISELNVQVLIYGVIATSLGSASATTAIAGMSVVLHKRYVQQRYVAPTCFDCKGQLSKLGRPRLELTILSGDLDLPDLDTSPRIPSFSLTGWR